MELDSLEAIKIFCYKYGKKPLIIDTNVLLLLFIGIFNKDFIERCSLTSGKYSPDDFETLKQVIRYFKSEVIITPYILTEVSNLSKTNIKDPYFHIYFAKITDILRHYQEHHITLENLLKIDFKLLSRFGFPDMSIVEVAKQIGAVVLTDEINLHEQLLYKKIPVMKFSYITTKKFLT